jgi:hypothetical protein
LGNVLRDENISQKLKIFIFMPIAEVSEKVKSIIALLGAEFGYNYDFLTCFGLFRLLLSVWFCLEIVYNQTVRTIK